jgi:hypothetical protein
MIRSRPGGRHRRGHAVLSVVVGATFGLVGLGGCDTTEPRVPDPEWQGLEVGDPVPGLTPAEMARFREGAALFRRIFSPEEGLGPLFNENACNACHTDPGDGGTGDQFMSVPRGTAPRRAATCSSIREATTSVSRSPPFFGRTGSPETTFPRLRPRSAGSTFLSCSGLGWSKPFPRRRSWLVKTPTMPPATVFQAEPPGMPRGGSLASAKRPHDHNPRLHRRSAQVGDGPHHPPPPR